MKPDHQSLIYNFLNQHQIGVISTIDPHNRPESAVVGFAQTPKLELTFGTLSDSRKSKNLQSNPNVAFVVGWDDNITVQYEGTARLLPSQDWEIYQAAHFAKLPSAKKYASNPKNVYYLIQSTYIRYTDLNVYPWKIIELTF